MTVSAKTRARARVITNIAPQMHSLRSERILWRRNASSASAPRTTEAPLIYVVDDMPDLTGLYSTVLEETGYRVRAINDRAEAVAALKADRTKPDLLITDYLGHAMPIDRFLQECLVVHPALRILMASGFRQVHVQFSRARPERFIQKPFTLAEFRQEIKAALTA